MKNKRLTFISAALMMAMSYCAHAAIVHTNSQSLVLTNCADGTFTDFRWNWAGYDTEAVILNYDTDLGASTRASFRMRRPKDGTIFKEVLNEDITISTTQLTFTVDGGTNMVPVGSYWAEVITYDTSTNIYRTVAQGMINVNWSLFKDDDEYFEYYTNIHSLAASLIVYQGTSFPGNVTFSGSGFYTDGTNFIFTGLGTGAVASVFGRDGAVVAAAGDYAAFYATTNYAVTLSNLFVAHRDATGTNVHGLGTMALEGTGSYYTATAADALLLAKASTSELAAVEAKADQGVAAYLWGPHDEAGYLTSTNTRYDALDVADLDLISTNISGLTDGTYTGVVTTVAFTGAMDTVAGRFYVWGFTKQNNFGTGTLSAAGAELIVTAAGTASNYFKALSTDSNLVLRLDGTGSSKSDASNVFVYEVTNGLMSAVFVRAKTAYFEELILAAGGDLGLTGVDVRISDSTETNNPTTKSEVDALLSGKASTVDLGTVSGMVVIANGNIATNAQNIGSISTRVDNAEGAIITNSGNIATNAQAIGALSNDVEIIKTNYTQLPDFGGLSGRVDIVETNYVALPDYYAHISNETADIQHLTAAEKLLATQSIQGVTIVTGATASAETNSGIVKLTVPDPGASVSQWSAYEQTSLVYRVHQPTHESGWLTPYTNAWSAGWTDAGAGYTNEGSPLLYPEHDIPGVLAGQYLYNSFTTNETSSVASVSYALTNNDSVEGLEIRMDYCGDVYNGWITGMVYYTVGGITSDVHYVDMNAGVEAFTTTNMGGTNLLWGVDSSSFVGQTNINLCFDYITINVDGGSCFLDYLSANITYANEGFFGTNYFGYDATGKFVASDTGTNRYPLVELDTLSNQIAAIEGTDTNSFIAVSNRVDDLMGRTDIWNTAATDASAATGNVAIIQSDLTTVSNITVGVSNDVEIVKTNYVQLPDFTAHTNNEAADIQHLTAAEKLLATNAVQIGADGTSTNLSDYNNDAGFLTTDTGATNIAASATDSYNPGTRTLTWNTNAAGGGGITLDDVKNVAPLMTNSDNIIMGKNASGNSYGVALGSTASASSFGAAVGQGANGITYGVGIGANANGGTYGVSIGYLSLGASSGAAIGRKANGQNYSFAGGAYSYAISNSVALGAYVTNDVPGTTRVRGDLYLDGGTKIYTRDTFNSGGFSEYGNTPFQGFSSSVEAVDGTATVVYASGNLVRIEATNNTEITFDNTDFPTNGVNRVWIELLAGSHTITFNEATITNAVAPTPSTENWTSLEFRRTTTNLWRGVQY